MFQPIRYSVIVEKVNSKKKLLNRIGIICSFKFSSLLCKNTIVFAYTRAASEHRRYYTGLEHILKLVGCSRVVGQDVKCFEKFLLPQLIFFESCTSPALFFRGAWTVCYVFFEIREIVIGVGYGAEPVDVRWECA
jgi:hypothetical protein